MKIAHRRLLAALVLVVALPLVGRADDGSMNRTVAVDARGIPEALEVVYKAESVANELTPATQPPQ